MNEDKTPNPKNIPFFNNTIKLLSILAMVVVMMVGCLVPFYSHYQMNMKVKKLVDSSHGGRMSMKRGEVMILLPEKWGDWLYEQIGSEYQLAFNNITYVDVAWKNDVKDSDLIVLKNLTQLESLNLDGAKIDGSGFAHLKNLKKLETLSLSHTLITDNNLIYLNSLTGLTKIELDHCRNLKGRGLLHLKKNSNLRFVGIGENDLTDFEKKEWRTKFDVMEKSMSKCEFAYYVMS